jgi:hypothetical protein
MTKDELQEMIGTVVEEKLAEFLGDPDEGLPLKKRVREQLVRQMAAVARGERGKPYEEVVRRLS